MGSLADFCDVVIGVDTHADTLTAAAVAASTGGVLGYRTVDACPGGYRELARFADEYSGVRAWAVEGTGSYGAGLTRHLVGAAERVVEVDRPERSRRRNNAKSDEIDAVRCAREALVRQYPAPPRSGGVRKALAVLLVVRRSAVRAAGDAQRQLRAVMIAAPDQVRDRFRGKTTLQMTAIASRMHTHPSWDAETRVTVTCLRSLAKRIQAHTRDARQHEHEIHQLIRDTHPGLLELTGVGPITAAAVVCGWSHPGRIRSEAAFGMLAGTAPIPAESGKTTGRRRLNRSGDRQLNAAIHTIVLTRLRHDPETRAYMQRRTSEGKTRRDTIRCLKRYVTRQLYRHLENTP